MSDPFLYLEDLEKAVPKPPASIGDQGKAPSGKATLSGIGKPQATPKASAGAKLSATNTMPKPPASIGDQGGKVPSAQTTLNQKSSVPSPAANAKAMASGGEWDYWEGSGAPTGAGWERGPKGGWRRPAGMGGGGSGETESLLEEMKTPQQEAKDATAAQSSPKKTVSSGQDAGPVSSSAEKIEQAKRSPEQQIDDMLREKKPGPGKPDTQFATADVRTAAHKEVQAAAGEDEAKQALLGGGDTKADSAAAQRIKEGKDWVDSTAKKREAAKKLKNAAEKQVKEELASQAKEGEKPKKPSNKEIEAQAMTMELEADTHREGANQMLTKVRQYQELEQDPARKEQLDKLASILEKQGSVDGVPSEGDKKLLAASKKASATLDKFYKPQIKEQEKQAAEQEKQQRKAPPKVNYGRVFDQARAAGEQIGGAAATLEGGGELATSAINYTSSGAVRGGHHLLSSKGEKKAADSAAKKAPKKGAEVEQSSMKTEKSLGIYLDLQKAVQTGTPHGHTTPSEDRARIKHESSYAKRPVGVANEGIVTEDDEDKGKDWKHADEDSVQTSVNQKLEAKEKDGEKEEEKEEVTKSLTPDPLAMLKSLNSEVQNELRRVLPTDLESTFMIEVLDYDPIVVSKGQGYIRGKDRHRFNEWAHERLSKSISSLHERVGLND